MLLATLRSPNRRERVIRGDVRFERDGINLLQLNYFTYVKFTKSYKPEITLLRFFLGPCKGPVKMRGPYVMLH